MARRIEHRAEYAYPAGLVYAALTDEGFLRERLSKIGGRQSELLSFTVDGGTTTAVMRQSIDAKNLPGIVRGVTPHGVTIERVETWTAPSSAPVSAPSSGPASGPSSGPASGPASARPSGPASDPSAGQGRNGRYTGTVEASVSGFSGSLHGATALTDSSTGTKAGCVLVLDGDVKVSFPLVGGRIEAVIVEQLGRLLSAEARFTDRWLESHPE